MGLPGFYNHIINKGFDKVILLDTWPRKPFWTQRIELLGDVGRLESRFGPFRDSVSVDARKVNGLRQMYHQHRNRFGRTHS
jgi:hypothetical protein